MPNHLHGILALQPEFVPAARSRRIDAPQHSKAMRGATRAGVAPASLGAVVRSFKAAVTRRARKEMNLCAPVWQRNYYEHIVRNGDDLMEIRNYVRVNPLRWCLDRENPDLQS